MNIYKRKRGIIYFFNDFLKHQYKYFKHYKRNIFIKDFICIQKSYEYYMFIYFILISKMIMENKNKHEIENDLTNIFQKNGVKNDKILILFRYDELIYVIRQYLNKRVKLHNKIFTNVQTIIFNEIKNYF